MDQTRRKAPCWMSSIRTDVEKPTRFSARVLCWLEHSKHTHTHARTHTHTLIPVEKLCLIEVISLPTNHDAKSELYQLMIILINPQNFMHGQYSANLLILDRNLLKPVERMKRQNLMNVFYLGGYKSWQFDDSKSDLFANSNITLS